MLLGSRLLLVSQPPPVHDPEEVKQAADEILSRAEFGEAPLTLLERIARWIADLFGDGSPSSDTTTTPGTGGSGLLTMVLLLLLVVGLAFVIRALLRQPSRRKTDADPEPTIEVTEHLSASAWEREAAAHEADGRWKDALRCRFRALLEQLVERRVIDEVPGRTTGELRAEVADRAPGAHHDFTAAADLFDVAWYGDTDTGADDVRRLVEHAGRVLAATQREPVAAAVAPEGDQP
jgi:hypothetical protein